MVQVLEALVAKGRRVRHPCEQREVAYGLADISTQSDLHHRIVKKGGIKTLLYILTTSRDVEAKRFAALSLANTASAEMHRVEIGNLNDSVSILINFVKDSDIDLATRQYCAMALGNLAAEPANHNLIVNVGGIDALASLLKFSVSKQNFESGQYASFALSNLAVNINNRKLIVDEGTVEPLIVLACSDDVTLQRQSLSVLRGICIDCEYRVLVVQLGILDPIILMARSNKVETLREVAAALSCLSSVIENRKNVADRAISTIIALLLWGDDEVEYHACCAIANLSELLEIHVKMLEEHALPPIISMISSEDMKCKGEAARVIANLSSNADMHDALLRNGALLPVVKALENGEMNCQKFSVICVANLAITVSSQIKIIQSSAVRPLITIILNKEKQTETKRYSSLALANLSATSENHAVILEMGALEALFSLANSVDPMSQYYVACTVANLSYNKDNHTFIVEEGGIQPILNLAYSSDSDVHQRAAAAIRSLSMTGNVKMKIVQEGGLEPLSRLLLSKDIDVLREVVSCFYYLSIGEENKIEIAKSGVVSLLITHIQSDDIQVSSRSAACLANLAEIPNNQALIALDGGIQPCLDIMRSNCKSVQREGGRLIANLCISKQEVVADTIIQYGGHQILTSFLLSKDMVCQHIGAIGICNLCVHNRHRVTLTKCGVLEPLLILVRAEESEIDIKRLSAVAIANLASSVDNHECLIEKGILPLLVSLSNSIDTELRQYSAVAISKIAQNFNMRHLVTQEGGLEPILYLAKTNESKVNCEILPAIAALSFSDENKINICQNGGLSAVIENLCNKNNIETSRLACCALANITEAVDNMKIVVKAGVIISLAEALSIDSSQVKREAIRSLGNLAVNIDYGSMIIKENILPQLLSCLADEEDDCQRMAAMALTNLSTNFKMHDKIIGNGVFTALITKFRVSLDPKCISDHETARFCLILVANLSVNCLNHPIIIDQILILLVQFTGHCDIKCRQYAVFVLGNLCSNQQNIDTMYNNGVLPILTLFSFPPAESDFIVQYQSISGIRGIAMINSLREKIVECGGLEPLVLASTGIAWKKNIEVKREAAAALCNMTLADSIKKIMAFSGTIPALLELSSLSDNICQVFAIRAISNLAESGKAVRIRLIKENCLKTLMNLITCIGTEMEVRKDIIRCFALLAMNTDCHDELIRCHVLSSSVQIMGKRNFGVCFRFCSLLIGNLALNHVNHDDLLAIGILPHLMNLSLSPDNKTRRCVAFAFRNLCANKKTHNTCEKLLIMQSLIALLSTVDLDTQLLACLALKDLCVSPLSRIQFLEYDGLGELLKLGKMESLELKREVAAALRNISLSDQGKESIFNEGGIIILVEFFRSPDDKLLYQSCGVIANLSEAIVNQEAMVRGGILHHLKFVMRSLSSDVVREVIRAITNLSYDYTCTSLIVSAGVLVYLVKEIVSRDSFCQQFAVMAIANISTNQDNHTHIIEEKGLQPLIDIVFEKIPNCCTKKYSFFALTNISASHCYHKELVQLGIIGIAIDFMSSSCEKIRLSSLLCLSNLASNSSNHTVLYESECLSQILTHLTSTDNQCILFAVSAIRGFSTNEILRTEILRLRGLDALFLLITTVDVEIQMEVLAAICNLTLDNSMGKYPVLFSEKVKINDLVSFLCSTDRTYCLFGAVTIGNIASETILQSALLEGGVLRPLIAVSKYADMESQRCIAYAMCNLCALESNHMEIIKEGGLPPIISLACSTCSKDMIIALTTLTYLSTSNPIIRLNIVKCGGLKALSLVLTRKDQIESQKLSIITICALSLNEVNKVHIVNSAIIQQLVDLLTSEISIEMSLLSLRVISNCCENENLHKKVIADFFDNVTLDSIKHHNNSQLQRELSRCYCNLSGNSKHHDYLFKGNIFQVLIDLCISPDPVASQFSMLGLLNLTLETKNHKTILEHNDFLDILFRALSGRLIKKYDKGEKQSKSYVNTSECMEMSKRYACLTFGCLVESKTSHKKIQLRGFIPLIVKLLLEEDIETVFYASFALHKLSMNEDMITALKEAKTDRFLINIFEKVDSAQIGHAIAVLRNLSIDKEISISIVNNHGFAILAKVFKSAIKEIERELGACFYYLTLSQTNKMCMIKSVALEPLLHLCRCADHEVARFALGALANIAEDFLSHEVLVSQKRVISYLIRLIQSKSISIKREASRAVSNLLTNSIAQQEVMLDDGFQILISISHMEDQECQYNVALSCNKLSSCSSNHKDMIANGCICVLFRLIECDDAPTSYQAAESLKKLASNHLFKVSIAECVGLKNIINIMEKMSPTIYVIIACVLRHFSISTTLKLAMYQEGVIQAIEGCIKSTNNTDFLLQCATIVANISEHSKIIGKMENMINPLFKMTSYNIIEIQTQLARGFCFLSYKDGRLEKPIESRLIETLVHMISSTNDIVIMSDVAGALGNLAIDHPRQIFICKLGIFPPLLKLLHSSSEKSKICACRALARFLIPKENKKRFLDTVQNLKVLVELCQSKNEDMLQNVSKVLCNVSSCLKLQQLLLEQNGIEAHFRLISSSCSLSKINGLKSLCNMASTPLIRESLVRNGVILYLSKLMFSCNPDCKKYSMMILCNLSKDIGYSVAIINAGVLQSLLIILFKNQTIPFKRAAILILYNLSISQTCHKIMLVEDISEPIINLCKSSDCHTRRYTLMILCNLAANKETRTDVTKNGGLQAVILMLSNSDKQCKIYACICLANMANDRNTQIQAILHGGLPSLIRCISDIDPFLRNSARICIGNLAANKANCNSIMNQGAFKALIIRFNSESLEKIDFSAFAISNLSLNSDFLDQIGRDNGIKPLLHLISSSNECCKCLAIVSLRRLFTCSTNREQLVTHQFLEILSNLGSTPNFEIQREVVACICDLTLVIKDKQFIIKCCFSQLVSLLKSDDTEITQFSVSALANLAEDVKDHFLMKNVGLSKILVDLLQHENINVCREASRLASNLFSSIENQDHIICNEGFGALLKLSVTDDKQCKLNIALYLRKLSDSKIYHDIIVDQGLPYLFLMLKVQCSQTNRLAATAIKNVCAGHDDLKTRFLMAKGVDEMTLLLQKKDTKLQILAVESLRHLSSIKTLRNSIFKSDAICYTLNIIACACYNLNCQVCGLIANMSVHYESQICMVEFGIIPVILNFLRYKSFEMTQDCARIIANLVAKKENQSKIYKQGGMSVLIQLTVHTRKCICTQYTAIGIRFLVTHAFVRKAIIQENTLLALISLSYSPLIDYQRSAASVFASLTLENEGKVKLMKHKGFSAILSLCISSDLYTQRDSTFAAANMANFCDIHSEILIENGVKMMQKVAMSGDIKVVRDVARYFSLLSCCDKAKDSIIQNGFLKILSTYSKSRDISTQRYTALALCNLSSGEHSKKEILNENGVLKSLIFLSRFPDLEIERCAALAISALYLGVNQAKIEIFLEFGVLKSLLRIIQYPNCEIQQCASMAINCLLLGNDSTKRHISASDKGLFALLSLLRTSDEVCIYNGIYALGSLIECKEIRSLLVHEKCIQSVVKHVDPSSSINVKRACGYFLSLLAECSEYHSELEKEGGLEAIITVAEEIDNECQDYSAFSIAVLASNQEFQILLVKKGAVRPLVLMMATDSAPKYYAGLALLKLANNFENHIAIAEEGGIQALLKMGRSVTADEEVQYKTALTVGTLASNAISDLSK